MIEQIIYNEFQDINIELSEEDNFQDILINNDESQKEEHKYYVYIKIPESKVNNTFQIVLNFQNNSTANAKFYFNCNGEKITFVNQKQDFILIQDSGTIQYSINIIFNINAEKDKELFFMDQTLNEISITNTIKDVLKSKIDDAPIDNQLYGRKNGDWSFVTSSSNGVSSFNSRIGSVTSQTGDYSMSQISGTATIAQGGTGQTTAQNALNALSGSTTSGRYLRGNGTNVVMSTIQAADVPILNQNTTGSAASFTGALGGDVSGTQFNARVTGINRVFLGNLTTGLLKNTTGTGTPSIAFPDIDYVLPSSVYLKRAIDDTIYPQNIRYWFRSTISTLKGQIPSKSALEVDVTTLLQSQPTIANFEITNTKILVEGVVCPLRMSTSGSNANIIADAATMNAYNFNVILRFNVRLSIKNAGTFKVELRRPNGITPILGASSYLTLPSLNSENTPVSFQVVIPTRIFSGGDDPFQTEGFRVFIISETIENAMIFDSSDANNFQIILEN